MVPRMDATVSLMYTGDPGGLLEVGMPIVNRCEGQEQNRNKNNMKTMVIAGKICFDYSLEYDR